MTKDDIAHLQTIGRDAQAARKDYILKDDQDKVWDHLKSLKGDGVKVDFILDNGEYIVNRTTHGSFHYTLSQLDSR